MQAVDPVNEWRDTIKNYEMSKTNLQFNQPPQKYVNHKEMKQIETMYNPILQRYTDSNYEKEVQKFEQTNLVDTLAQNKDRALRYEQTFDVINFDDKLKGLENQEGYPKPKGKNKNVIGGAKTFTEYNIISNLSFKEHHYLPPEERPEPPKEKPKATKKVTTTGLRDYNVITNRYLELNDEKVVVDKEIERLNAAKKYWKTHSYDPISIQYYDPDQEKKFQETKVEKEKTHGQDWVQKLPKSWKEEGGLYNPVNGVIEDEERLWERDLREKNKRKRYEIRYDMEKQARKHGLGENERQDKIALNKVNVQRFRDTTDRGFDILSNKQFNNPVDKGSKTIFQPLVQPPPSTWTKIKNSSNAFDNFHPQSSSRRSESNLERLDEEVEAGELNDRLYATTQIDFSQTQAMERRSKRLMKGSQTMSNFNKANTNSTEKFQTKNSQAMNNDISNKQIKEIPASIIENPSQSNQIRRETNQSALRRSSNYSERVSRKSNTIGSSTSKAGKNIISPQSKRSSVLSSNRAIRTGAFQRIKS